MIRAGEAQREVIGSVLGRRPELAMFPLANLAAHGMTGGHDRSMTFWLDDIERPTVVIGVTRAGMVMPFCTGDLDAARAACVLRGRFLTGFAGPAAPVRALLHALDLAGAPVHCAEEEPQFLLALANMEMPSGGGDLAPLSVDRDRAIRWRMAYDIELHLGHGTPAGAAKTVDGWIAAGSHRFLMADGRPVAMTGFNATLPDIVQVGGVYTPPEARGRGLARRALALHLAEARDAGATRATLFAASDAAVACYAPLGFRRIGDYALVLFDGEVTA